MVAFPLAIFSGILFLGVKAFSPETQETIVPPPIVSAVSADATTTSSDGEEVSDSEPVATSTASSTDDISLPATSTTTTSITTTAESGVKKDPTEIIVPKPLVVAGAEVTSQDAIGGGWASNSWGIDTTFGNKSKALAVAYTKPWSALSLYSSGYALTKMNSIEVQLVSPATDPSTLFVSLYSAKEKIGSVALAPYQVSNQPVGYFRIPLSDIGTTTNRLITEVVVESARAQKVSIAKIRFSRVHAHSQLVVTPAPSPITEVVVPPPAPVITPDPVAAPAPLPLAPYATGPYVYRNGLQDDWTVVAKRGAVVDILADTEQSVTGAAMKVHFDLQDGSLSFVHPRGIKTGEYHTLHMYIYGGVTDREWQQLILTAYDENGNKLGSTDVMKYSGNSTLRMQTWNKADIPLNFINATNAVIKTIDIENVAVTKTVEANDHMWIDDVRFMNDASY